MGTTKNASNTANIRILNTAPIYNLTDEILLLPPPSNEKSDQLIFKKKIRFKSEPIRRNKLE